MASLVNPPSPQPPLTRCTIIASLINAHHLVFIDLEPHGLCSITQLATRPERESVTLFDMFAMCLFMYTAVRDKPSCCYNYHTMKVYVVLRSEKLCFREENEEG